MPSPASHGFLTWEIVALRELLETVRAAVLKGENSTMELKCGETRHFRFLAITSPVSQVIKYSGCLVNIS